MKELILDENLFILDNLLVELADFSFDEEVTKRLRELSKFVNKKLYSELDPRDLKEYHIIFRYEVEDENNKI